MKRLTGETGDSVLLESKLASWAESKENLVFRDFNIKKWGSYDLLVSVDNGKSWLHTGKTWGWGFTLESAFAHSLLDWWEGGSLPSELERFLGSDLVEEIRSIIETHEEKRN